VLSRIKNTTSLERGLFQKWINKNINVRKNLNEKYKLRNYAYYAQRIIQRNFTLKRAARSGLILGKTTSRYYLRRKNKSYKYKIHLIAAYTDMVFDSLLYRAKRVFLKMKMLNKLKIKHFYHVLRKQYMKLLKKRVFPFFSKFFNLRKYEIKYSLYISTGKFRTAKSASNFFARKTKMRFSIWESIKPYIRKSRRYLHGLFIGCYGRYRKKTRVKETVIKKGSVSFSSFSANIDFGKSTVRTKFGIANFKVWMAYSTRTREDMLRHFKKVNYIYIRRLNYSLKTKPTLRYFSSFLLPSIKKKEQIIIHAHTHDVKLKIYPRNFDRYLTWLRKFKSKMCINLKKK